MMIRLTIIICVLICTLQSFASSDTSIIRTHLVNITKTQGFRTYKDIRTLNKTASYIDSVFRLYADTVYFQTYIVSGNEYKNVIASFGTQHTKMIITGAHYDVCDEQQGADDNASGIVGLLELARQLQGKTLTHRIDLVAYTLEEPPFFRSEWMGSGVHARSIKKENITGMVCLEMIGYFSDQKKSQDYPLGFLKLFYGGKGNYITLVKKPERESSSKNLNVLSNAQNLSGQKYLPVRHLYQALISVIIRITGKQE